MRHKYTSDMNTLNHCIIIAGSTGVGKSDFAQSLADHFPIEIINCDIGQFYTPLTIGTAKPHWKAATIPHHFFDIIDSPKNFTIIEYRKQIEPLLQQILTRGNIPVIAGGSTFYLHALFYQTQHDECAGNETTGTWQDLYAVDPGRARAIHERDIYRINRALTVWRATGKKPSQNQLVYKPIAPFTLLFLQRPRVQLYERINTRVELMVQQGWVEEVAQLKNTDWAQFLTRKKIIGYNELLEYLDADNTHMTMKDTIAKIQQRTRNYAKRQLTFWRMLEKKVNAELAQNPATDSACMAIDLTLMDHDLYIKQLSQKLFK